MSTRKLKVLVVGGGGREHALVWALRRSASVGEVICAPGNAGIAARCRCLPVDLGDLEAIARLADAEAVDLVVVGPEAPLIAGLADLLQSRGRAVFGCSRQAAQIEGSKHFAKELMVKCGVPTAAFGRFDSLAAGSAYIDRLLGGGARRLVIKADAPAAGKGVVLCEGAAEAKQELAAMLAGKTVGAAGHNVVIEEFLVGRELSLMALVDGERVTPLPPAEDHKTIFEGDVGPMTGGMGAVSPPSVACDVAELVARVLAPTARGLVAAGAPFRGLLYAGLMLTQAGPKVLEFNCRFGDPETQAVLARLDDDLGELLLAIASGRPVEAVRVRPGAAVTVVMAAAGYPGAYERGAPIEGIEGAEALPGVTVFHAGTALRDGALVTAGGRVLGVTAVGADLEEARRRAYKGVDAIHVPGAQVRRDIGRRSR